MDIDIEQSILNKSKFDKFVMVFDVPKILRNWDRKLERSNTTIQRDAVQFSIYGSVIPDIQVPATLAKYGGSTLKVTSAARPEYPPLSVNFTIDNRFNNYWVIYTWLNALRSAKDGLYATAVNMENNLEPFMLTPDYTTDICIFGKDEYDQDIIKWTYKAAFPTLLKGINFDYRNPQEIESAFDFEYTELSCELL